MALIICKRSLSRRRRVASRKAKSQKTIKRSVAERRPTLKWKPHEAHFSWMNFPFPCCASINWFSPHSNVTRFGESEAYGKWKRPTTHTRAIRELFRNVSWIICQHKKSDLSSYRRRLCCMPEEGARRCWHHFLVFASPLIFHLIIPPYDVDSFHSRPED